MSTSHRKVPTPSRVLRPAQVFHRARRWAQHRHRLHRAVLQQPLAHGVMTGKYSPGQPPLPGSRAASSEMNQFMETAGRHYRSDYLLEAVAQLKPIAADLGLTMVQLALAWVLRRPEVSSAIIGASRPEQVEANARAVGIMLPEAVLQRIDDAIGKVVVGE